MFIADPLLALVPGFLFLAVYWRSRSRAALACAGVWVLYWLYEEAMKHRILCSGECNIRIDLLLVYPVLILMSIYALVVVLRGRAVSTRSDAAC